MNADRLARVTGVAGLALVVFAPGQFSLYVQGDPAISVCDGAAFRAACVPGMYGGPVDANGCYNEGGRRPTGQRPVGPPDLARKEGRQ
ncbi:MAG: hypothetical protein ACTHNK_20990 [Thermomicrobiales bacterium]